MSGLRCDVITIGDLEKHPNADTLSVTKVFGFQVVIKTDQWKPGDKAVYVPVDTVVGSHPEFDFLGDHKRIRAARLRGVYSEGLLIPARPHHNIGDNVSNELDCRKYEPPEPLSMGGENEQQPSWFHQYTDIENYKRYPTVLEPGERVSVTEKIHGANLRVCFKEGQLWVGSHHNAKKYDVNNMWWKAVLKLNIDWSKVPDVIFHGEVYGRVQDLTYGAGKNDLFVAFFDASVFENGHPRYLHSNNFLEYRDKLGFQTVPPLFAKGWDPEMVKEAEGKTMVSGADHIREGIVIKVYPERYHSRRTVDDYEGRVIFKVISEAYRLRKGGTEKH